MFYAIFDLKNRSVTFANGGRLRREMYGKEKLASVVEKSSHLPPDQILAAIEKDVRRFEPKSTLKLGSGGQSQRVALRLEWN
jgi:serine phosphatase RsbU (regulator of sigma subunit)